MRAAHLPKRARAQVPENTLSCWIDLGAPSHGADDAPSDCFGAQALGDVGWGTSATCRQASRNREQRLVPRLDAHTRHPRAPFPGDRRETSLIEKSIGGDRMISF